MNKDFITEIAPGRIFVECGPISMMIAAWQNGAPLAGLCKQAARQAVACLEAITSCRRESSLPWGECRPEKLTPTARKMWDAVRLTGDSTMTPMAAVAGAIADVTADWLAAHGATKVICNNGGDIALRLAPGEELIAGIAPRIGSARFSHTLRLTAFDGAGGIATSGFGGRSFTRGIADAVTVVARSAAVADAFATFLANASFIESMAVKQALAKELDPSTDIPELTVTTRIGRLSPAEKERSLQQIENTAAGALRRGDILAVIAQVQGHDRICPEFYSPKITKTEG
ncbi:MAG: UPF0280 family protein [Negativicutes bacterium]|nr:UPF0280 family protein [Negativicutes bacterium]